VGGVLTRGLAGALLGAALLAAPAVAAPPPLVSLASTGLTSPSAKDRSCDSRPLAGAGIVKRSATVPSAGWVTARLDGAGRGDWDLAIYGRHNRLVAASTQSGPDEIAQGIAGTGERLSVQACRRTGSSALAHLAVETRAFGTAKPATLSLVRVSTPTQARKTELANLGLDLTEHGGKDFVEVLLHGADDAATLRKHQFVFVTKVANVTKLDKTARARDSAFANRVHASALPSGRTTYRRLNDYTGEMKKLVAANPTLVKGITLPFKTFLGRSVQGIEITPNVTARDGKPVFLMMGVHHAREWPSGEHAMEWAYEMVNDYKRGDARVRRLLGSVRMIVVPIVNPDGFNTSREAGQTAGFGGGRPNDPTADEAALATPYEYQRKNCRINNPNGADPARGDCTQVGQPNVGLSQFGVDPNRNYGGFWGGPGASADGPPPGGDYAQDYRGSGPFSEPETQNIRDLVAHRQVATLITNHTFSDLVLRPPGIQVQGDPPDEGIYKALGDAMARENGYTSQKSFQLYDTTGGTEDWTYYATGGLGFTFEIGLGGFHPTYADGVVAHYEGTAAEAKAIGGHGNREAYFKALESTADVTKHSLLYGRGPTGGIIRLRKSFKTSTSPVINSEGVEGKPILFDDALNSTMAVPDGGVFNWNVNQSTRPVVAKQRGRAAHGSPSGPQSFDNNTPAAPCGAATPAPPCYKDFPITVPAGAGIDNARATVEVTWGTAASDYDVTIYRDTNGDGTSDDEPDSAIVGSSAQGTTNSESATFGEPAETIAGKKYVVRVVNFAGAEPFDVRVSYGGPAPIVPAQKENWTLTCEVPEGRVVTRQEVYVGRGERKRVNLRACVARACIANASGRVRGSTVGKARLNRKRRTQRRVLRGRIVSRRGGLDRYCVRGGGAMRIGYPLRRYRRKISRKERRRVRDRALVILTTSKHYRIKGVRNGSRVSTLRRRFRGERRFKIGRNTWYIVRGSKSRLVFKTRGKRVLEVGVADRRLTRSRRSAKRLLASWRLR
jgi:hypothetical protein